MPVTRNQSNNAGAAKPTTSNANTSNKESTDRGEASVEAEQQRRESPENCSICLGPFNNKSFTSSCAHSFCFICLKQWSKVKAECPLCKQPFTSIFHNIRSDQSYDIYELPTLHPSRHNGFEFYFPSSLATFSAHTQPYLSLAQPGLDADLTLSNFSRFQFRHRRYDRYLQHPVHGEHQYSFLFNPATHVSAASWPRGAEDFRHAVYKHRLGPPLFILGNETSTYRLTPAMVTASAHRLQRIMPWLTRELKVLLKSHQSVRLAISIIQPLLTQVLIDSLHFNEKVSPLIGRKARQFIQEFVAFANSALTVQAFDRKAIYFRQDTSTLLLDNSSSRSSNDDDDDDIVEITDVSSDPEIIAPSSPVAGSSGLLRAGWNSPTPGPSWGNLDAFNTLPNMDIETVSVSSESDDPVFRPDLIDSDSSSQAGSDIVFLKYDKPWTERSPIKLSSDSDSERRHKKRSSKHKKKKREHLAAEDHKSSGRLKSYEVSKQKNNSGEDTLVLQETSIALKKRVHSSSSEKQKRKKKKKNRDRELVDRLFAQALSHKLNSPRNIDLDDGPCSSKTTDIGKSSNTEKFKHKHKKKDRKRSGDSQSSSNIHSYKKHHSGHKKSGDKNPQPENGKKQKKTKHNSRGDNIPGCSNESESSRWDTQLLRTQPLQSQSIVGHNNLSQPNYLTVPDTLQHIPLNLWVSAWPAIPTSHAFSGAPPSSTFLTSSLPHSSNAALDSNALLSDSSSETNSDDTEDYSISSVTTSTRTKQWLDENFSHSKKLTINSSKAADPKNAPIWHTINSHCTQIGKQCQGTTSTLKSVVNVVSVSDDEDVVVCSSSGTSSSSKSDYDVEVIKDVTQSACYSTNITSISLCQPSRSANKKREDTQNNSDFEQNSKTVNSLSTRQLDVSTTQLEVSTTQLEMSTTQLEVSTTQHEASTTQLEASTTQLEASTTQLEASTTQLEASTTQLELLKPLLNNENENAIVNQLRNPIALTQENTYIAENNHGNLMPIDCLISNNVNAPIKQSAESVTSNSRIHLTESGSVCTSQTVFDNNSSNSLSVPLFNTSILTSMSSKPSQPHSVPLNLSLNSVPPLNAAIFSHIFQSHTQSIPQVASTSNSIHYKSSSPKAPKSKNVLSFAVEEILSNSDNLSTDSQSRNESVNSIEDNAIADALLDQQRTHSLDGSLDSIALNLQMLNGGETNNSPTQS